MSERLNPMQPNALRRIAGTFTLMTATMLGAAGCSEFDYRCDGPSVSEADLGDALRATGLDDPDKVTAALEEMTFCNGPDGGMFDSVRVRDVESNGGGKNRVPEKFISYPE